MLLWLTLACATEPQDLPTQVSVAQANAALEQAVHPPMVQLIG